jgi:hypothetical protein
MKMSIASRRRSARPWCAAPESQGRGEQAEELDRDQVSLLDVHEAERTQQRHGSQGDHQQRPATTPREGQGSSEAGQEQREVCVTFGRIRVEGEPLTHQRVEAQRDPSARMLPNGVEQSIPELLG